MKVDFKTMNFFTKKVKTFSVNYPNECSDFLDIFAEKENISDKVAFNHFVLSWLRDSGDFDSDLIYKIDGEASFGEEEALPIVIPYVRVFSHFNCRQVLSFNYLNELMYCVFVGRSFPIDGIYILNGRNIKCLQEF